MLKEIQLRIDKPCSESWGQMTPGEQGRFCQSCNKTVVDFAAMDDREILKWFAQYQGAVCGRFRPEQLHRSLTAAPDGNDRSRYWQYLLAGLLFTSEISAQTTPVRPPMSLQPVPGGEGRHITGDTVVYTPARVSADLIRGRVVDDRGHPVPYATVKYDERHGVMADNNGYFSIVGDRAAPIRMITISAVGYQTIQIEAGKLHADGQQPTPVVVMTAPQTLTGDVVVVAVRHRKKRITDTVSLFKDTLACAGFAKKVFAVYPNPVARGNTITLSARLDQSGTYKAELFNISGSLMEVLDVEGGRKTGNVTMNIPADLAPGAYVVRLSHPALKKYYTQEIIVF